jgi:hypothetical protein
MSPAAGWRRPTRRLAPGSLSKGDAYKVWVAALDILGLTTAEAGGGTVKVLSYREFDQLAAKH